MERSEIRAAAAAAAAMAGAFAVSGTEAFTAARSPQSTARGRWNAKAAATPLGAATPGPAATATASRWGLALASMATAGAVSGKARRKMRRQAVPPEALDFLQQMQHAAQAGHGNANPSDILQQVQEFWQHAHAAHGDAQTVPAAADLAAALQQWADTLSEGAGRLAHEMVPPAYAAEVELDPNTTYLYGADGSVLVDPMNGKPLPDDWWNGFIGFQAGLIKGIDQFLRENGLELSSKTLFLVQWL